MGTRRQYSQTFKEDAVRLLRARGTRTVADIAAQLGVSPSQLHRWNATLGGAESPSESKGTTDIDDVEALRRRLRQVEQENALLKKAAALFAKDVK